MGPRRRVNGLEAQRKILEDLEVIEDAIAQRFNRNPALYYSYVDKAAQIDTQVKTYPLSIVTANTIYNAKKQFRSRKQTMLQQHEISIFLSDFVKKKQRLKSHLTAHYLKDESLQFSKLSRMVEEIDKKYSDDTAETQLDINNTIHQYQMFSDVQGQIQSERARNLSINSIFTKEELYGEQLDLERFFADWLVVIQNADCSLLQFYKSMECFLSTEGYLLHPPMDRKNDRYMRFLCKLAEYLESYFYKTYALIDKLYAKQLTDESFESYVCKPVEITEKGHYCVICAKWFQTMSVFDSHLNGKTHGKNFQIRSVGLRGEYKVHKYMSLLESQFKETRDFLERKLAFTPTERIREMERFTKVYESPSYSPEEKEDEEDGPNSIQNGENNKNLLAGTLNMPLGPDGLPMPYWLYKLQGLDITYACEICGNRIYKGRRVFEKHFTEATHVYHLRCLGIEPSSAFNGITDVNEATSLWESMQSFRKSATNAKDQSSTKNGTPLDIEVEDAEGNVMSQQIYAELRKQGLA